MKVHTLSRISSLLLLIGSLRCDPNVVAQDDPTLGGNEFYKREIEKAQTLIHTHSVENKNDKIHAKIDLLLHRRLHVQEEKNVNRHIRRRVVPYHLDDLSSDARFIQRNDEVSYDIKSISSKAKRLFIQECLSFHTTSPVIDDNIISQLDYTNFLSHICIITENCAYDDEISFGSISVPLKLKFLWLSCRKNASLDTSCADNAFNAIKDGIEFGITITKDIQEEVETKMEDFCTELWPLTYSYHGGVAIPTASPTNNPSSNPSEIPYIAEATPSPASIEASSKAIGSMNSREIVMVAATAGLILVCMYIGFSRKENNSTIEKDNTVLGSNNRNLTNSNDGDGQMIDQNETGSTLPFFSPNTSRTDENQISQLDLAMMDGDWNAMASIARRINVDDSSIGSSSHPVNELVSSRTDEIDRMTSGGKWGSTTSSPSGTSSNDEVQSNDSKSSGNSSIFSLVINKAEVSTSEIHSYPISPISRETESNSSADEDPDRSSEESIDSISELFQSDTSTLSGPSSSGPSSSSTEQHSNRRITNQLSDHHMLHGPSEFYSQSTSSSDSKNGSTTNQSMISDTNIDQSNKVKNWFSRFFPGKQQKNNEYSNLSQSELAFQEDSSVSSQSWEQGGSSEDDTLVKIDNEKKMKALLSTNEMIKNDTMEVEGNYEQTSVESSSISKQQGFGQSLNTGEQIATMNTTNAEDIDDNIDDLYSLDDSKTSASSSAIQQSAAVESIDGDKIATLEKLIEADDWQGIVPYAANTDIRPHDEDSTIDSQQNCENSTAGISFGTPSLVTDASDEDQSFKHVWASFANAPDE